MQTVQPSMWHELPLQPTTISAGIYYLANITAEVFSDVTIELPDPENIEKDILQATFLHLLSSWESFLISMAAILDFCPYNVLPKVGRVWGLRIVKYI